MPEDQIPPFLQGAMRGLDEALGRLRTTRIRASQLEVPDVEPPDPRELAEAAKQPGAPPQLQNLATAVAAGRTTWEKIIEMGVANAVVEFEAPAPEPVRSRRPGPSDDEIDDFSESTLMRRDW